MNKVYANPEKVVMWFHAAAAVTAAARLLFLGMAKRQLALLCYLLFTAGGVYGLSLLPLRSGSYFYFYMACLAIGFAVNVAAVRELFSLTLEAYPGIRSAARWIMYGAIALSLLTSLLITAASWDGGRRGRSYLYYVAQFNRSTQLGLAVVIISHLIFLSRYPLNLPRNSNSSAHFFSAVYLTEAAVVLIDLQAWHLYALDAEIAGMALEAGIFLVWALVLRKEDPVRQIQYPSPAELELLLELQALNRTLSSAGQR